MGQLFLAKLTIFLVTISVAYGWGSKYSEEMSRDFVRKMYNCEIPWWQDHCRNGVWVGKRLGGRWGSKWSAEDLFGDRRPDYPRRKRCYLKNHPGCVNGIWYGGNRGRGVLYFGEYERTRCPPPRQNFFCYSKNGEKPHPIYF